MILSELKRLPKSRCVRRDSKDPVENHAHRVTKRVVADGHADPQANTVIPLYHVASEDQIRSSNSALQL